MKYFAFYDQNNVVTQVLPVPDSASEAEFSARIGMACKETYKNESTRGKFAGAGYSYIPDHDIFVEAKVFSSWVLDVSAAKWIPPVAQPDDGGKYVWDEDNSDWKAIGLEHGPASENLSEADMQILQNVNADDSASDVLSRLSPEGRAWVEASS